MNAIYSILTSILFMQFAEYWRGEWSERVFVALAIVSYLLSTLTKRVER